MSLLHRLNALPALTSVCDRKFFYIIFANAFIYAFLSWQCFAPLPALLSYQSLSAPLPYLAPCRCDVSHRLCGYISHRAFSYFC